METMLPTLVSRYLGLNEELKSLQKDISDTYYDIVGVFTDIRPGDVIEVTYLPSCTKIYDKEKKRMNSKEYINGKKIVYKVDRIYFRYNDINTLIKNDRLNISQLYLDVHTTNLGWRRFSQSYYISVENLNYRIVK